MPTLLDNKYVGAAPKYDDARCRATSIADILTTEHADDAHFTAYDSEHPRRLSRELLSADAALLRAVNVRMVLAAFDVDGPGHREGIAPPDSWSAGEAPKLEALLREHAGAFMYETRGGYRIVYALPHQVTIHSVDDAEAWRVLYKSWVRYLHRRFGIVADPKCSDWTRLFRAPSVVRDAVKQSPATLGDPNALGLWAPQLAREDFVAANPVKKTYGAVEPIPIADPTNDYGQSRIRAGIDYLLAAPLSIDGAGGRNVFFGVACCLMRRLRLPIEIATDLVERVYNPRLIAIGTTTWDGDDIEERLDSAANTASDVPPFHVMPEEEWRRWRGLERRLAA